MATRLTLILAATAGLLAAQDPPPVAGRISYINGNVSFQPAGVNDWAPATRNRPLTISDQLYSGDGARAEVQVPGTTFRLGSRTAFEFLNLDGRMDQIRLSEGTLIVDARQLEPGANVEIDTPNLAFSLNRPGFYRIDTNPDQSQTYVTVRDGQGQITSNSGAFALYARQQAVFNGDQYNVYAAPGYDDFDNWSTTRDRRGARYASARYVSPYMVGYEDLDDNGSWRSVPDYGEMWIPRGVPAGWAPYHDGHWAWVDPWGWTWVDDQPWGFAPFHYGRWANVGGSWGWCPGPVSVEPVYAPALVAWLGFGGGIGVSLGFGGGEGVGWLPLGPRDVYIPSYAASQTYITRINTTNTTYVNNTTITNVYNNYSRTGNLPMNTYSNRSVPGAVMAVPQTALASARPVQQVGRRIEAAQMNSVRAAAAPRVAPQVASVLGHSPSAGANVARPAAAILSRPIVARTAPPAAAPAFQQRQAFLEKNPGRPMPVAQMHQMARSAPAAAPVRVISSARTVAPHVNNTPAPQGGAAAQAPRPSAAGGRTFEPPAAQRPGQPVPTQAAPAPAQAQRPAVQSRPFEPPAAQPRAGQPQQARVPTPTPAQAQRPAVQSRQFEPPAAQPRAGQPQQARVPTPAPAQAQRPAVQSRPFEPPAAQPRAGQPQQARVPAPVQAPAQARRNVEPQRVQPQAPRPAARPTEGQANRMRQPEPQQPAARPLQPPARPLQPERAQPQARPAPAPQAERRVEMPRPQAQPQTRPQPQPVRRQPEARPAAPPPHREVEQPRPAARPAAPPPAEHKAPPPKNGKEKEKQP